MKFSVTKEKLLEALQQVQNVVSTRTTLPILSNVLLQANEGELYLTTTDLDVGVRGTCEERSRNHQSAEYKAWGDFHSEGSGRRCGQRYVSDW